MPRLADVLVALPRRAFLDVELKESFGREIVEVLAAGRGPELNHAVLSSFDPEVIARLRGARAGLAVVAQRARPLREHDRHRDRARLRRRLGRGAARWTPGPSGRPTRRASQVAAWTVTRRSTFRRLVELGVVAVCVEGEALTG